MNSNFIAYALDFTSFYLQKTKYKDNIKEIILFGSVARQEASTKSDIDLFIDITKKDSKMEEEAKNITSAYYNSTKFNSYWKLLGIKNEINVIVGDLKKWKSLEQSIIANGITLFGKHTPTIKKGTYYCFFVWENVTPNSKRVLFNKQLFGYNQHQKFYLGLLQKYNAQKLGKGCIVVPVEQSTIFLKHFQRYKVNVKMRKVLEY